MNQLLTLHKFQSYFTINEYITAFNDNF